MILELLLREAGHLSCLPLHRYAPHFSAALATSTPIQQLQPIALHDVRTTIRGCAFSGPGFEHVTLLRWSPDGAHLLTGNGSARFRIWETQTWTSLLWRAQVRHAHFKNAFKRLLSGPGQVAKSLDSA